MACHLVDRGDTLGESHVELLSADNIGLFNHLVEHSLKSLITPLNATNLFWAYERGRIDADALLGHGLSKYTTVVKSAVAGNELRPTEGSDPAFNELVQATG